MLKTFRSQLLATLVLFLLLETISFSAFFNPVINQLMCLVLIVITLLLSLYRLEYGLLVVLGELFIGSMGHLFDFAAGAHQLPIRIALWSVVMVVFAGQWLYQWYQSGRQGAYWTSLKTFPGRRILGWLFLFITLGLLNGLARQHSLTIILSDFNAWLYFLTILPLVVVYGSREAEALERLRVVFLAGAIWLSLKTLFLVFIFTHNYSSAPEIYSWLRQSLVGEMTPTVTGWPRIFIQGQIFSAIAFGLVLWYQAADEKLRKFWSAGNLLSLSLAALFLSTVLLSFSRSFWVGLAAAIAFSLIWIWRQSGLKKLALTIGWTVAASLLSLVLIYLVVAFPYWQKTSEDFGSSFLARANSGSDAAITSRWSLLPVLMRAIEQEPFFGQGFGSTVTYFSSDPRVLLTNAGGTYTTYAFEWGYLSLWLKIGLLGTLVYLLFLWQLVRDSLKIASQNKNYIFFALPAGIIFLAVTNAFTPYLNHPLGIGFLVLSSCLIWPNRVY